MSLFLNKNSHSGRNSCICKVLQRRLTRASSRDKAISGNQPIQETHVVCNIVAGVVMLVLACVFMVGWVRSSSIHEEAWVPTGRFRGVGLISLDRHLGFAMSDDSEGRTFVVTRPCWTAFDFAPIDSLVVVESGTVWQWRIGGFAAVLREQSRLVVRIFIAPYWSIVIPLTLLSAWLLLSNPRSKPNTDTENS